jgi:hypothetical protein
MRRIAIVAIILIIVLLISASAYVLFFTGDDNEPEEKDTEAPEILSVTGNTTVAAGQSVTISTSFSDNVNVTEATLYYRNEGSTSWTAVSILSGSTSITIPSSATENWYYYVTVDDAAGNGPVGSPSTDGSTYYVIMVQPADGGDGGGNESFNHMVFIEESTSVTCRYCPAVGTILEDLETSADYASKFYYVSMVHENSIADEYLKDVYNFYADPTVFVDGGFQVISGGSNPESTYTNAIDAAITRAVLKVRVTVTAEYKNTTNTVLANVLVENKDPQEYSGSLRVYLTEIISSRFNDYDGLKYRNAFVDFLITKDITVSANGTASFSANYSASGLDYENLRIFAVVFNAEEHDAFAYPPDTNPFKAHYADAANATYVVQGVRNLPPEVGILSPQQGKLYRHDRLFLQFLYKKQLLRNTILIGKTTISAYAKDDNGIARVEFFVDTTLVANFTSAPYNWTTSTKLLKHPFFIPRKYTITVKAYDTTNKTATASIEVVAWRVF